jgi:hypothetical protein
MVSTKTKTIKDSDGNDRSVVVVQFVGSRANKNFVRLTQSFSGSSVICTPDQWQEFCKEFLSGTTIDGKEATAANNFDDIFSGNIGFLLEVVTFVGEANFGKSFLAGSGTGNMLTA